jgi:hypothetical protein
LTHPDKTTGLIGPDLNGEAVIELRADWGNGRAGEVINAAGPVNTLVNGRANITKQAQVQGFVIHE